MRQLNTIRIRVLSAIVFFAMALFLVVQYEYQTRLKGMLETTEQTKFETVADTVVPIMAVNLAFDLSEENSMYLKDLFARNRDLVAVKLLDERNATITQEERQTEHRVLTAVVRELEDPQNGTRLGTAELVFRNHTLETIEAEYKTFVTGFIMSAGVLLLLLMVILDRAFKPLQLLLEWIGRFDPKQDGIETMPEANTAEVEMIEASIVQLFDRIRHYTAELDRLNHDLDEKVQLRTNDLADANAQLHEEIHIRMAAEEALKVANERLKKLSRIDAMTGIANRRFFQEHLQEKWLVCSREQIPLTLVICDIDHFKAVNDTYGHPAGDVVIRTVAKTLQDEIKRATDLVARYGGEEFAIILFNTQMEDALHLIKRIQDRLRTLPAFSAPAELVEEVTLSFGICSHVPDASDQLDKFVISADRALYRAKEGGRNRMIYVAYDAGH